MISAIASEIPIIVNSMRFLLPSEAIGLDFLVKGVKNAPFIR
jgi:hypothetical protein